MGKAVLEGLEGIKVEDMEGALKKAGTYLGTMENINTGSEEQ